MRYLGGKTKIAKQIVEVILKTTNNRNRYIEPFVGGGSILKEISKYFNESFAYDIHPDLILMWQGLQDGSLILPETITLEQYQSFKNLSSSALRGFVGFGCSFGGKWFGGYARGETRNYTNESARNLKKTISKISKTTIFKNIDYKHIAIQKDDIIYCDPPFADTTGYFTKFNSNEFWDIVNKWSDLGAIVFVSEYKAPSNWECIWEKKHQRDLRSNLKTSEEVTEKLFIKKDKK